MSAEHPHRVTIVDVAREAGVSTSLVSLALSGAPRVADSTRERILKLAGELGYRRNALAAGLVSGRTGLLAVIVTDLASPYHADVASQVEAACDQASLTALILNGRRDPERLDSLLDQALRLQVDAVVVISSWIPVERLEAVGRLRPVAVVGRLEATPSHLDTVRNDDERGTGLAMQHLRSLGHRRIAALAGGSRPAQLARLVAYRADMAAHGDAGLVEEFGLDAVDTLVGRLREPGGPTAVFATNDNAAVDLLRQAADAGIAVPTQVSVVGYDDTALARSWRPRLSSVGQAIDVLGTRAVQMVAERLAGRTEARHEIVLGELAVRETTARPA